MPANIVNYVFTGGLNEQDKGIMVEDTEIVSGQNVEIFGKALRKRNGYSKLNSVTAGAATVDSGGMAVVGSTKYAWIACNGSILAAPYVNDVPTPTAGSFSSIKSGLTASKMDMANINDTIIWVNGTGGNEPQKSTDMATVSALSTDNARPTGANYVDSYGFRAVFSNVKIAYSAILRTTLAGLNNDIKYTAVTPGTSGNSITITYTDGTGDGTCSASAVGNAITVTFYNNSKTAEAVKNAINNTASTLALVYAELDDGNDGTGYVTTLGSTSLSGGSAAATYPFATIWSGFETPGTFKATDIKMWPRDGSDGITAQFVYKGKLFVATSKSIHMMSYVGVTELGTPYVFKPNVVTGLGIASNSSVVEVNGLVIFFGSDNRWYAFDGYAPIPISDKVKTTLDAFNRSYTDKVEAVYYKENNQLITTYNSSGTTASMKLLTADLAGFGEQGAGVRWNPLSTQPIYSLFILDYNNTQKPYGGSAAADGWVYALDSTTADDGAAINAYFTTKPYSLGNLSSKHEVLALDLWMKGQTGTNNLTVGIYVNGSATVSSTLTISQTSTLDMFNPAPQMIMQVDSARLIALKFTQGEASKPFELYLAGLVEIDNIGIV